MIIEEFHPFLPYLYTVLVMGGIICFGREVIRHFKGENVQTFSGLTSWTLRPLDLSLIIVFIYLVVFGAGTLTVEGYKYFLKVKEVPEDHFFIFGFPMHIAILGCLYGFFRYFDITYEKPINPVHQGIARTLGLAIYYFFAIIPLLLAVGYLWPMLLELLQLPTAHQDLVDQVRGMDLGPMFYTIAFLAVILAPISEELLFRAFIYRALKNYMPSLLSAIITSLMFALMHFNLLSFLPLFLLGFWLSRTYEKSGNIWVPILLHALFNGNTLVTLMLTGPEA